MFDPHNIRKDFPQFDNYKKDFGASLVYLDSASTSQTPSSVVEAMNNYYLHTRSSTHRGLYPLAQKATALFESSRLDVARFIGASVEEVIFVPSATYAANIALQSLAESISLSELDEIVIADTAHHALLVPVQMLAQKTGAQVRYVTAENGVYDLAKVFSEKTKLVLLSVADNITGQIYDIIPICREAKKKGVLSIVDGAQAVGHMAIDVKDIECDALFFSAHKMCGPTGVAVLYIREEVLKKLKPNIGGGAMVEAVDAHTYSVRSGVAGFEPGTMPIAEVIGLGAAVRYLSDIGVDEIYGHDRALALRAALKLNKIHGVTAYVVNPSIGIVSFAISGLHPHDVGHMLAEGHICVRAGYHCAEPGVRQIAPEGVVRVSFYLYNTDQDVEDLVEAVRLIAIRANL